MTYGMKINRKVDLSRKSTSNYSKLKINILSEDKYLFLKKKQSLKYMSKMAKYHAFRKYRYNDFEYSE